MSYIVPKDIPNCCGNCPYNYSSLMCKITKSEIDRDDEYRERLEDCQLIEIKTPHGRIIDANKIEYENWYLEETGESYKMVCKDDIDGMSAIIEAERSEK